MTAVNITKDRTVAIKVNVSEDERDCLAAAAQRLGMRTATFVRAEALRAAMRSAGVKS